MQQDNNIENTLRQLDNQQQPDLGNMETHWQQMQAMLQPEGISGKGASAGTIAIWTLISLLLMAGGAFLYHSFRGGDKISGGTFKNIPANEKSAVPVVVAVKDTAEKKPATQKSAAANKHQNNNNSHYSKYVNEEDSVLSAIKINFTPCETCPGKEINSSKNILNKQELLRDLFTQWKKEEQQFVINNNRDAVIQCAEGSVLLVPANSLGGKNGIVFSVKEFYKESDIILNQLNTVSNKDQLATGGMLQIKATLNGNDVAIDPAKPLRLFMKDTSSSMNEMQLFNGEIKASFPDLSNGKTETGEEGVMNNSARTNINWLPQYQYFSRKTLVTQVRVLNIIDQPFAIKEKRKGRIGYFIFEEDSLTMSKDKLKQLLKEKYGYYKIKLRSSIRNWFVLTNTEFNTEYATGIGDSLWMDKETADRYKLNGTATRQFVKNDVAAAYGSAAMLNGQSAELIKTMQNKYGVDIKKLGWINCDRFYNDPAEKKQYAVNLGDSAKNYYTMLVFDTIKSMMNGYADSNRVLFDNVPEGAAVKVISIGIDKTGETVYAIQPAVINKQELTGLQFQSTSAAGLKASLSKIDR